MKLEPIEYNGGVIWLDKNPQGYKKGEWCYGEPNNSELLYQFEEDLFPYNLGNKVVAQSSNLSLPNIPYVEVEEDVEQLLINDYKKVVGEELNKYEFKIIKWLAASAKKWSDEDMKNAYLEACGYHTNDDDSGYKSYEEFEASLQQKIKSIEIEMNTEYYVNKEWKSILLPSEWDNNNPTRQVPITYQKDGKTFLKSKSIIS